MNKKQEELYKIFPEYKMFDKGFYWEEKAKQLESNYMTVLDKKILDKLLHLDKTKKLFVSNLLDDLIDYQIRNKPVYDRKKDKKIK